MSRLENFSCVLWNTRLEQIDNFDGNCVVQAVKDQRETCFHFQGKAKHKVITAYVPNYCFIANFARRLPPIGEITS